MAENCTLQIFPKMQSFTTPTHGSTNQMPATPRKPKSTLPSSPIQGRRLDFTVDDPLIEFAGHYYADQARFREIPVLASYEFIETCENLGQDAKEEARKYLQANGYSVSHYTVLAFATEYDPEDYMHAPLLWST